MKLSVCAKVCKECPFSKDSIKGWLGDMDVDETLEAQQNEHLFTCHLQRTESAEVNYAMTVTGEQNICRGFLISAKLSCKSFGQNQKTGQALKALTDSLEITEEEREKIMPRWDFRKHHTLC